MFTVREVALRLRVSKAAVYHLIHSHRLHAVRVGNARNSPWRISAESLNSFCKDD
ncbi:helix-turn-helix domain-containing protein [Longispora sp. NPDC051575]|uniref:helix-turn-helix domain-containing protein n=1 Tax=Longispora sp. NPDC051575 TaxID=3154943 RepID=UPI0034197423